MNRGRLFATIEHIERGLERPKRSPPGSQSLHAASPAERSSAETAAPPKPLPTPRTRAEELFRPRPILTASPAAIATAEQRARRTEPVTMGPAPPNPKGAVKLSAPALKATLVLDPAAVGQIELMEGKPAPPFLIEVDGRKVMAQLSAKSLRKALGIIAEHGADNAVVLLRGRLAAGDKLDEAGLVAEAKKSKETVQ